MTLRVDQTQAATRNVNVGDVYDTVQIYLGSSFVNLFTRYGHNYMVYLQADPLRRLNADDVKNLYVRNSGGGMVPVGALAEIRPALGTSVVSLYNLFPAATINGMPAAGFSSGQALDAMETIARPGAAARHELRMDGHVLPGEAGRQLHLLHLRPRDPARLLRARRPVRELDHAGRRHPRRADGPARDGGGAAAASASPTTSTCRSAWCC